MGLNTTPTKRPASGSISCGSWQRNANGLWLLTCPSRPSAMWRPTAMSFAGYRAPGCTERLLGYVRTQTQWNRRLAGCLHCCPAPLTAKVRFVVETDVDSGMTQFKVMNRLNKIVFARTGAVLYALWGLVHYRAAHDVYQLARSTSLTIEHGRLEQLAFYLA